MTLHLHFVIAVIVGGIASFIAHEILLSKPTSHEKDDNIGIIVFVVVFLTTMAFLLWLKPVPGWGG